MAFVKIKCNRKIISKKAQLLEAEHEKSRGLMLKKHGEVLMKFDKESRIGTSIHTVFCVPLVVAWLDKKLRVVDVKKTFPCWFYMSKKPAMYIFETTDTKKKIKPGDKFSIIKIK